jgi:hypothetical protein
MQLRRTAGGAGGGRQPILGAGLLVALVGGGLLLNASLFNGTKGNPVPLLFC